MKTSFKKSVSIVMLLLVSLWMTGCDKPVKEEAATSSVPENKLKVYTSFYPMYDFAKKVGGDKIEVTNLVPAGMEPHDWEPTTKDIENLEHADMLIYNGAGMEHWVEDVVGALSNKDLVLVEASKGIELMEGHHHDHDDHNHEGEVAHNHDDHNHEGEVDHDHDDHNHEGEADHNHDDHNHGHYDPHVWTSIKNAKKEMETIKEALVARDPENATFYEENYRMYAKQFDELDKTFEEKISALPNKNIVVSHEAFGYLCKDYGLNQMGIEGLSPESEPNPTRMAAVVDFVKEHNIKTIFFEELVSPKVAETIAKETGAVTDMLNPIEGLSQEQLDEGMDYLKIQEKNLIAIEKALK